MNENENECIKWLKMKMNEYEWIKTIENEWIKMNENANVWKWVKMKMNEKKNE